MPEFGLGSAETGELGSTKQREREGKSRERKGEARRRREMGSSGRDS